MKKIKFKFAYFIVLFSALFITFKGQTQNRVEIVPPDFKGKLLVALSDADMVSSAYEDGKLGPYAGKDALTFVSFSSLNKGVATVKSLHISNSVIGPPDCLAVDPSGKFAIVVETHKERPETNKELLRQDLLPGKLISVINMLTFPNPKIIQQFEGSQQNPLSVSINKAGNLVAITYLTLNGKQKSLVIYQFDHGKLSNPQDIDIPGWNTGDELIGATFYSENVLALVNSYKSSLTFYKFSGVGSALRLNQWGNTVAVQKGPYLVCFTPNQKFALCNAIAVPNSDKGAVTAIQIAADTLPDGTPIHKTVSIAETGFGPEGLAISPDGQWVVTANSEHTSQPLDNPKRTLFSSLTLLRIDQTGHLTHVKDFAFSGMLPETVIFDNSSKYVAVTNFDHNKDFPPGGSIDFWQLEADKNTPGRMELVQTGYSVPVRRGVNTMVLSR